MLNLNAWRHGKGFGVHSPLAYDLIHNVLTDKPAYYGDAVIKKWPGTTRQRRVARILVRLTAHFHMRTLWADTACPSMYVNAVKLACPGITVTPKATLRLEMENGRLNVTVDLGQGGPLVIRDPRDITLTINRRGLSPQLISAKL